jgi:SAM-dependent methyltransferase
MRTLDISSTRSSPPIGPKDNALTSRTTVQDVAEFYDQKTRTVLRRYGPGPRAHYRTGFVDELEVSDTTVALRKQIVAAQERVLYHAGEFWQLRRFPFRDVLDAGCGLGGGAIFWAQEFGAHVTAVTIAPSHVDLVAKFAAQAGVESRVRPLLCDALKVPGDSCFDAAIALDSSDTFRAHHGSAGSPRFCGQAVTSSYTIASSCGPSTPIRSIDIGVRKSEPSTSILSPPGMPGFDQNSSRMSPIERVISGR